MPIIENYAPTYTATMDSNDGAIVVCVSTSNETLMIEQGENIVRVSDLKEAKELVKVLKKAIFAAFSEEG